MELQEAGVWKPDTEAGQASGCHMRLATGARPRKPLKARGGALQGVGVPAFGLTTEMSHQPGRWGGPGTRQPAPSESWCGERTPQLWMDLQGAGPLLRSPTGGQESKGCQVPKDTGQAELGQILVLCNCTCMLGGVTHL